MLGSRLVQYHHTGDVLAERLHPLSRARDDGRYDVALSSVGFLAVLRFVLILGCDARLARKFPQTQDMQSLIESPPTGTLRGFVRLNDRSTGTAR
jgi:hypothetical protein